MTKLLIFAVNQGGPRFHEINFSDRQSAAEASEQIIKAFDISRGWEIRTVLIEGHVSGA